MSEFVFITKKLLRPFKRKLQSLFRRMTVEPSVIQLFLYGSYETRYTLVNFPSLYSPLNSCSCIYDVELYGADGDCIDRKTLEINMYGSIEVRPSDLFGIPLPEYGIFCAKIRPNKNFMFNHLGKIRSQIYALFSDDKQNSFVLIHPQTFINQSSIKNYHWLSAVKIDARKVRKIVAFQPNPTSKYFESTYSLLCDDNGKKRIANTHVFIPPMGVRKIEWDLNVLNITDGYVSISASSLPTGNGKPILFNYFKDGSFTGMHG